MHKKLLTLGFALTVSSSAWAGLGFADLAADLARDSKINLCISSVRKYESSLIFEVACNGKPNTYWELGQNFSVLQPLIAQVYSTLKAAGMQRTCQDSYTCIFER